MKNVEWMALALAAPAIVVGLALASASCDKGDKPTFGGGGSAEEELSCTEERGDCPTEGALEGSSREGLFGDAPPLAAFSTSAWGWSTELIDFRCCTVTGAVFRGEAESDFSFAWESYGEDGTPLEGGFELIEAGTFEIEFEFQAENEFKGVYLTAGALTEPEVREFGPTTLSFEVAPYTE